MARCPITDLEALYSAESPRDYERVRARREAAYPNLALTASAARRALEVQRLLARRSQHRGAGLADLLIAAIAEEHGVTVLHYDADYDLIAAQTGQVVAWVVPRGTVAISTGRRYPGLAPPEEGDRRTRHVHVTDCGRQSVGGNT